MKTTPIITQELERIYQNQLQGKKTWVIFEKPNNQRTGSIGLIELPKDFIDSSRTVYSNTSVHWYAYSSRSVIIRFPEVSKKTIRVKSQHLFSQVKIIEDYEGEPVLTDVTDFGPPPVLLDQFGVEIKPNDFIVYLSYGKVSFATVQKITQSKRVYIRTMSGAESYILDVGQIVIVDDKLRQRAMLKKLSGGV